MPVHSRATDHEVLKKATEIIGAAERRQEMALVEEVVTRASKRQGAVVGLDPTLWALNHGVMHLLVLAGESDKDGRYCQGCDFILPLANTLCPQCNGKTFRVNLWEELPGFALRRRIGLEVVHGEAAEMLWRHDGLGGQLKPTPR
jgi:peptide subunit release factor 1 (eRF1)